MEQKDKTCDNCAFNVDLLSDIVGSCYWCKQINIPLLTPKETVCDRFKFTKRQCNNPFNFRKVGKNDNSYDNK